MCIRPRSYTFQHMFWNHEGLDRDLESVMGRFDAGELGQDADWIGIYGGSELHIARRCAGLKIYSIRPGVGP